MNYWNNCFVYLNFCVTLLGWTHSSPAKSTELIFPAAPSFFWKIAWIQRKCKGISKIVSLFSWVYFFRSVFHPFSRIEEFKRVGIAIQNAHYSHSSSCFDRVTRETRASSLWSRLPSSYPSTAFYIHMLLSEARPRNQFRFNLCGEALCYFLFPFLHISLSLSLVP